MTLQTPQMIQESQPTFAGIDVGAEEPILVVRKNGTSCKAQKFTTHPR